MKPVFSSVQHPDLAISLSRRDHGLGTHTTITARNQATSTRSIGHLIKDATLVYVLQQCFPTETPLLLGGLRAPADLSTISEPEQLTWKSDPATYAVTNTSVRFSRIYKEEKPTNQPNPPTLLTPHFSNHHRSGYHICQQCLTCRTTL